MAEERKPLTDFRLHRTQNGGWVISELNDQRDMGMRPFMYSYSSDADMLAALPGLIVVPVNQAR